MNKRISAVAVPIIAALGVAASANTPQPLPTPSASLGIEVDVKPAEGRPGQFLLTSVVTDLETDQVIAQPRLLIAANRPARIETGNEGKWRLQIAVTADGGARKAAYEATFSRSGKVVSKQRISVNLNG